MTAYGYSYETGRSAVHFTTGRAGKRPSGITIHHWGSTGQRFDDVVAFLCSRRANNPTSAHYVAQGANADGRVSKRVACIVDPDDTAWHAGNWPANLATIGIECRPEARDIDYVVVAELVRRLRGVYGNLPLYPHKHWTATSCPGKWDLAKLDRLARLAPSTTTNPKEGSDVALTKEDARTIITGAGICVNVLAPNPTKAPRVSLSYLVEHSAVLAKQAATTAAENRGQLAGILKALQQITGGQPVDLEAITAAAKAGALEGVAAGIDGIDVVVRAEQ